MRDELLDLALKRICVVQRMEDYDLERLPEPIRTAAVVFGTQGIIDNGGLRFFFDNDYPWWPPYSLFINAYRRIGARRDAEKLERAAALFPFPDPHLHRYRRRQFLDSAEGAAFDALDREHDGVWKLLRAYVEAHRAEILGERE